MEGGIQRNTWLVGLRLVMTAVVAVFVLFGLPVTILAQERQVVINEMMWDGLEYIELLNITEETIDLTGWTLTRQQAGGGVKEIIKFEQGDVIGAQDYYLIEEKEEATAIMADKIRSGLVLVNAGELVSLLDEEGIVIDQANRLGMWWAGKDTATGIAMERNEEIEDGTRVDSWHTSIKNEGSRLGTPGTENSVPEANNVPEAAIGGPSVGVVGEELVFTAEDSVDLDGDELSFVWEMGDGAVVAGEEIDYEYEQPGLYLVKLVVSDGEDDDESTIEVLVKELNYSEEIVINELLPNPEGSDSEGEFIELKNIGKETVVLGGWQLDDGEGGSKAYIIENVEIVGGEIVLFNRVDTKIVLNNTEDSVRLLDPAGEIKSSYSYVGPEEGGSYNRTDDGEYIISTTSTPGEENQITEEEKVDDEEEEASSEEEGVVAGEMIVETILANVRDEEEGTRVEVEGVVSVPPGVFGERIIYLAGSGIQVYYSKEDWPVLKLGDVVKLTGELSSVRGEARLKLAQAENITVERAGEPALPHAVETGEVGEDKEGWLVTVQGYVTRTSGDTFYIDDGTGEIKVYIKKSTSIDKPKMRKGVAVTITGVVSETTSGYRILPRWQEDVRLGLVKGLTSFPATGRNVAWLGLLLIISGFLFFLGRKKREPLLVIY